MVKHVLHEASLFVQYVFYRKHITAIKRSWANDKYQHKRQSHHHHHHHHWHKRSGDALNPCLVLTTKGFWGRGSRQRRTFHFNPSSGAAHSYFSQNLNRFLKFTSKPQTRPDSWSSKDNITFCKSFDLLMILCSYFKYLINKSLTRFFICNLLMSRFMFR